jgi:hypothetical protein
MRIDTLKTFKLCCRISDWRLLHERVTSRENSEVNAYPEEEAMDLGDVLEKNRDGTLATAVSSLDRLHLPYYMRLGEAGMFWRLRNLFELTVRSVKTASLLPVTAYSEGLGEDRFASGADLYEVQAAFNALQEAMWKHLVKDVEPRMLRSALGLVSTVLGAGKDALARRYVLLASTRKKRSVDVMASFRGSP